MTENEIFEIAEKFNKILLMKGMKELKMTLLDTIRQDMNKALKAGWVNEKLTLSMLLGALQLKEKEKRAPLTEAEENEVLMKEIKQTKETIDTAPANRWDITESAQSRLQILEAYAPKQMTESQILMMVNKVIDSLGLTNHTAKTDKGKIMKELMPITKGKADGKLVNQIVDEKLSKEN